MTEKYENQQPEPTEGMKVLGEIFADMLSEEDVFDGMHAAREAIRKKEADLKDLASEIKVTEEERNKALEAGATQEEIGQVNLKLLGLQALRQDLRHREEYP